jgi:AAA domain
MALTWDELKDTSDTDPPITVIYGPAKIGKTTLASEWPSPYYCRTGDGERQADGTPMKSFGVSETYSDVLDQIAWMLEAEHDRQTFVLDALDGLEDLINAEACARHGWANIEDPMFSEGHKKAFVIWQEFKKLVLKLKKAGFYVVLIAHVKQKTVPGVTTDSYPRYMLNIRDEPGAAIVDASDLIGYLHQRVSIVKEKAGFHKDNVRTRGDSGGEVNIAVQERPGYIAGNRYGIAKAALPYKKGEGFKMLSEYFPPQPDGKKQEAA